MGGRQPSMAAVEEQDTQGNETVTLMNANAKDMRHLWKPMVLAGVSLLAFAWYGLWEDWEWVAQPFYAYVWWGYVIILDGLCVFKRGRSLLSSRRKLLVPMLFWSTSFWTFFELLNIRFQNWYYVGVDPIASFVDAFTSLAFIVLAFGTVFVGIFETIETLTVFGLWRHRRSRGVRRLPTWISYAIQAVGLIMISLSLLFPYYLAPLVWGSFSFLIDPWNYRRGARSLLRDIESGNWGLLLRVLLAGLICGAVWESMNFLAPQKWIYTVRGLENLKLFEMPLLGFLGFPALVLDSIAGFALFSTFFLGNVTWEDQEDLSHRITSINKPRHRLFYLSLPLQICFWVVVAELSMGVNLGSVQLQLSDLRLSPSEQALFHAAGYSRPRQLCKFLRDSSKSEVLEANFGWNRDRIRSVLDQIELYTFKGIGSYYGQALERVGVKRVTDLCNWDVESLTTRLTNESNKTPTFHPPRIEMVRVWVFSARGRCTSYAKHRAERERNQRRQPEMLAARSVAPPRPRSLPAILMSEHFGRVAQHVVWKFWLSKGTFPRV
jgi:hypothetical protein